MMPKNCYVGHSFGDGIFAFDPTVTRDRAFVAQISITTLFKEIISRGSNAHLINSEIESYSLSFFISQLEEETDFLVIHCKNMEQ
jgi:hypothetical protein